MGLRSLAVRLTWPIGCHAPSPRLVIQPAALRLAALEPQRKASWKHPRRAHEEMVVRRQQLEDAQPQGATGVGAVTGHYIHVHGHAFSRTLEGPASPTRQLASEWQQRAAAQLSSSMTTQPSTSANDSRVHVSPMAPTPSMPRHIVPSRYLPNPARRQPKTPWPCASALIPRLRAERTRPTQTWLFPACNVNIR